eukprot:scaffold299569_cov17-Tisochrysis_lutea.AAC.1
MDAAGLNAAAALQSCSSSPHAIVLHTVHAGPRRIQSTQPPHTLFTLLLCLSLIRAGTEEG